MDKKHITVSDAIECAFPATLLYTGGTAIVISFIVVTMFLFNSKVEFFIFVGMVIITLICISALDIEIATYPNEEDDEWKR